MTDSTAATVAKQLKEATHRLRTVSETPRLDAELLLCESLGWDRTALYTRDYHVLAIDEFQRFDSMLDRRIQGMPVAYLLKRQEFWSLPLHVDESVLIPRADTELLVETVLCRLATNANSILELGTGSGAIALAVATERPDLRITACDIDQSALDVARRNAQALGVKSITFSVSDWFGQLVATDYDAIVSNPPYIAENDPHLASGSIRFEPRHALVSGADGLDAIRHIAQHAREHLLASGWLFLEHGFDQGPGVCNILSHWGYTGIATLEDAAGQARVTLGQYNHEHR